MLGEGTFSLRSATTKLWGQAGLTQGSLCKFGTTILGEQAPSRAGGVQGARGSLVWQRHALLPAGEPPRSGMVNAAGTATGGKRPRSL